MNNNGQNENTLTLCSAWLVSNYWVVFECKCRLKARTNENIIIANEVLTIDKIEYLLICTIHINGS